MMLRTGGKDLRLERLAEGKVLLRHLQTNAIKFVSDRQVFDAIQSGQLQLAATDAAVKSKQDAEVAAPQGHIVGIRQESEAAVLVMVAKRRWLEALKSQGITQLVDEPWVRVTIERLANKELAGVQRFEISTLLSAARKVKQAGGDWTVLIPLNSMRGGRGKTRTDPRAEEIIKQILAKKSETPDTFVKQKIIDEVGDVIRSQNLALVGNEIEVPGASTIARRIDANLTNFEVCVRNQGRSHANKTYRNNAQSRDVAAFPLLVSEYDDTDCGVFLVDDKTGLPCGRAYLTAGVDQNSAVLLGYDLGHQPRSYESAIGAIADSLIPKEMERTDFLNCKHPWIGYGAQGTILMDNASYNKSMSMRHRRDEMQLMLAGTKPYGPTEKCAIEHFNDVFKSDFCPDLPGWRGNKKDPDAVKHGMSHSVLHVGDFRGRFTQWVTDQYLNKPGEDGLTPKQRWHAHFRHHGPAVRWSAEQVAMLRLRPLYLRFRDNGGLETLKLRYWSEQLAVLRRELGAKADVLVYMDPKDLSYLLTLHPRTKALSHVPCVMDPDYIRGLTRYQQSLVLKFARSKKINNPSMHELVSARRDFAVYISQLSRSKKLTERKLAQNAGDLELRAKEGIDNKLRVPKIATPEVVMTQLEYSMHELDTIELSEEDAW
jgi:putative transposase